MGPTAVPLPVSICNAAVVDDAGRFLLSGKFDGDSSITIAFDSAGHETWRRYSGGVSNDAIALGGEGTVFVATRFSQDAQWMAINAYDSLGRFRWTDSCKGRTYGMAVAPSGQVAVAGFRSGAWLTAVFLPRLSVIENTVRGLEHTLVLTGEPSVFAGSATLRLRAEPMQSVCLRIYEADGRLVRNLG